MRKKWSQSTEWVVDRIWPRITGPAERLPKDSELTFGGPEEVLLKAEEYAHALATKAEERETTIDRKLFSLFSLSSVASSVMIAVLIGAATITVTDSTTAPKYLVIPAIGLVAYIALQMLIAVRNTVKGLEARPFRRGTTGSVIPKDDDDKTKYVTRQLNSMVNNTNQNDRITNQKVNHMNLAHTALANTFWPALALLVIALVLALLRIFQ